MGDWLSSAHSLLGLETQELASFRRKKGAGNVLLPALFWSHTTAFLSRSSHSSFNSLPLACSQITASTVAQAEEGSSTCTDSEDPDAQDGARSLSRRHKENFTCSLSHIPKLLLHGVPWFPSKPMLYFVCQTFSLIIRLTTHWVLGWKSL